MKKLKADIDELGVTAAQALELGDKVKTLEAEVKHLNKETNRLTEAYNTERVGIPPCVFKLLLLRVYKVHRDVIKTHSITVL